MLPRTCKLLTSSLPFVLAASAFGQEPAGEPEGEQTSGVEVIKIEYANAEEVAALLARIAPPGVTVTAWPPTNSVLITGEPAALRAFDEAAGKAAGEREPPRDQQ